MTKIYYNNVDVFSGLAPTPLVQLKEDPVRYGELWAIAETITLNGQITGKCETFSQLLNKQNSLISNFSSQFKPLKIDEDGTNIYTWPLVKVKSVNFSESRYSQLLDFSIDLECYDSGKFSGYYGVLEPKNEISYGNDENGFVTVNHTSSAKGINTNTSATGGLLNAKNYVSTISGWSNISGFTPAFVSGISGTNPVLISLKEKIDRFNNIYSVEESWSYNPASSGYGLLKYTESLSSGIEDGVIQVTVNGSLEGGQNISMSNLRTRFTSLNIDSLASSALVEYSSETLNTNELSTNITENSFDNKIEFAYTYDNSPSTNPYLISSITIESSNISKCSAKFDGVFKYRGACLCNGEAGWTALESMANSYDYYTPTLAQWNLRGLSSKILSRFPSSRSITKNKNQCEISVNITYSEIGFTLPGDLEYMDITLNVTPSIRQYNGQPVFAVGEWHFTNLGYKNRAKYSINGSAKIKSCSSQSAGLSSVRNFINNLAGQHVVGSNKILEAGEITESESDKKLINFNFTWSALSSEFS